MPVFGPAVMTCGEFRVRPIVASNLPAELELKEDAPIASDDAFADMDLCGLCEKDALLDEPIIGRF